MKRKYIFLAIAAIAITIGGMDLSFFARTEAAASSRASEYSAFPTSQTTAFSPLVMLVMGRDHKLYYAAYNDASDMNGDGSLDITYQPNKIDYYGYFDAYKYYRYTHGRFEPAGTTSTKKVPSGNYWSGDFLNYLTMSRMDTLRKALYGGMRSTDTETETVLERAYIPQDAHSWGKEYAGEAIDGYKISDYTPLSNPTEGHRHLFASTTHSANGEPLLLVLTNRSERVWEWTARQASVASDRIGIGKDDPVSFDHRFVVRVKVADPAVGVESNCKLYPNGAYKPIGLLQRHGEDNAMYFGLLSGSYTKNMSGGVVRKNIGSIRDEINLKTGQIDTSTVGIIETINRFRIYDFSYANDGSQYRGGREVVNPMPVSSKKYPDWGNPIAEMMYETLRYFSRHGNGVPTAAYDYATSGSADNELGLPKVETWTDPFAQNGSPVACAKPVMLVISDIHPSYDSDEIPGAYSEFRDSGFSGGERLGDKVFNAYAECSEVGADISGKHYYIGQSMENRNSACTPKEVSWLPTIRGLCPEEPTKEGSYYAGAVAHFGRNTDLRTDLDGGQELTTYVVALSSPLPKIEIPVRNKVVTLVPTGKTVWADAPGFSSAEGDFQPTCSIVGFFVEEISEDKKRGKFRIHYEDVEQGGDHKTDAIVLYEYEVRDNNEIEIKLTKEYQNTDYVMHIGYVISGTTNDGTYLEVSSKPENDVAYYLDTPGDRNAPGRGGSTLLLSDAGVGEQPYDNDTVYSRSRVFTPSGSPAAGLLETPLWHAARWGGVADGENWDKDGDGTPDNYFYVINPLRLEEAMSRTFQTISKGSASGTASSVLANNSEGEATLLQAYFRPKLMVSSGELSWLGYLQSLWLDPWGNIREDSNGNGKLDRVNTSGSIQAGNADKIIEYDSDDDGNIRIRRYTSHYRYHPQNQYNDKCILEHLGLGVCATSNQYETITFDAITPIFEAGEKLHQRNAEDRIILTFVDDNWAADKSDPAKQIRFNVDNLSRIRPFLGVQDSDDGLYLDTGSTPDESVRAATLINYIRGTDFPTTRSRTLNGNVWKLGDIINSTPVTVSCPPDNYHMLYSDVSFQEYLDRFKDRETVVYVGANDGMLHAFTSWNYDASEEAYTRPIGTTEALGDELWAYIPQALLPHLKFLADPDYAHSYYVDLRPKVFDAQIGGEWKTLLLVGLNMGGKEISVTEKGYSRTFKPTYTCIDVTKPRNPKVLWERAYDNLGMTASIPTIAVTGKKKTNGVWNNGKWLAVFGSGPTEYSGTANQNGYIFVVDLETGEPYKNGDADWLFDTQASAAVMNSATSFDNNLTYNVDAIYFGSMIGDSDNGSVFKINTHGADGNPSENPREWSLSTMFQAAGPITAPITLSTDHNEQVWAFFGTGRYLSANDKISDAQQSFFGIKDPYYRRVGDQGTASQTDSEVKMDDLYDATGKEVVSQNYFAWNGLLEDARGKGGWYYKLDAGSPSERIISKATILGGIVFFPTFIPNSDACGFGGESYLYALYYETGTAYYKPVIEGAVNADGTVATRIFAGIGTAPPSLGFHIGRGVGATAFLQLSTGQILNIDVQTAFSLKSAITGWRDKSR